MPTTKKFKIVIEVEMQEDTLITAEVMQRAFGMASNYHELVMSPQWIADSEHEKPLLAALLANPAVYDKYIKADILSRLESLSFHDVCTLASIEGDSYEVLEELVQTLPTAAKQYFQKAIEEGILSESTALISACFQPTMTKITLENGE